MFECSAHRPGMVCVIGSQSVPGALLGEESRCAVGHLMMPYRAFGSADLNAWRQACRAVDPLSRSR